MSGNTKVVNCLVKYIRSVDRNENKFHDLKDWVENCEDGIYIARRGVVFIINEDKSRYRYPAENSFFC